MDGWRDYPSLDEMDMKIRGRGNSTWGHPKKPYQMKLMIKKNFWACLTIKMAISCRILR